MVKDYSSDIASAVKAGVAQAKAGLGSPHHEVMAALRHRVEKALADLQKND